MIESALYYWVVCNRCKVSAQEQSDFSAWADEGGAWEEASGSDWREIYVGFPADKRRGHLCDDCVLEVRAAMGYDACGEPHEDEDSPANHPVICLSCKQDAEPDTSNAARLDDAVALTMVCKSCGFQTFPTKAPVEPAKSPVSA